jgi:hypothetical protein
MDYRPLWLHHKNKSDPQKKKKRKEKGPLVGIFGHGQVISGATLDPS